MPPDPCTASSSSSDPSTARPDGIAAPGTAPPSGARSAGSTLSSPPGADPGRTLGAGKVRAGSDWPASPLAAVGRAFDLLAAPPTVYAVDCTSVPGLPDGPVAVDRLRRVLLSPVTTPAARDAVWRDLVARSRRPGSEGQGWTVVAAGMALPGLVAAAGGLTRGWKGETVDIDAEVLAGFVARLSTVDVSAPRVAGRLIDAGVRAGRRAQALAGDHDAVRVGETWSGPPTHPWDHPDWVLARAVAAGVLDRTEARLIAGTRLEEAPLAQVAAELRVDPELATDWRYRAEARLRQAIHAGELETSRTRTPRRAGESRRAAQLAWARRDRARWRQAGREDPHRQVG